MKRMRATGLFFDFKGFLFIVSFIHNLYFLGTHRLFLAFPPPLRSGGNAALSGMCLNLPSAPLRGEPGTGDGCPSGTAQRRIT
jgi:hypothetical protein